MANLPQTEFPFNLPRQSSNFWNIENAKNYLNESASKKLQAIIKDNTGKEIKYGTPKGCDTGILKDSEELQAIQDNLVIFFSQLYHHLIRNISFCTD
jgi:hypothetical protein